jgi:hypothetical protein
MPRNRINRYMTMMVKSAVASVELGFAGIVSNIDCVFFAAWLCWT